MSPASVERRRVAIPLLAATGTAWLAIVVRSSGTSLSSGGCCIPNLGPVSLFPDAIRLTLMRSDPPSMLLAWALMLVAMMLPMLASPLHHVLNRSLARRRFRSAVLFLIGYFGNWMAAGFLILALALTLRLLVPSPFLQVAIVGTVAMIWQCSPAKQICLNRAHAHAELAAFGRAADRDAFRFGIAHGDWCVGSCWALMLLSELFSTGHLVAMSLITFWVLAEHIERPTHPNWRFRAPLKSARLLLGQTRRLAQEMGWDPK